jgi:hypothetical protein
VQFITLLYFRHFVATGSQSMSRLSLIYTNTARANPLEDSYWKLKAVHLRRSTEYWSHNTELLLLSSVSRGLRLANWKPLRVKSFFSWQMELNLYKPRHRLQRHSTIPGGYLLFTYKCPFVKRILSRFASWRVRRGASRCCTGACPCVWIAICFCFLSSPWKLHVRGSL